jgi:hypothetical protein
VVDHRGTGLHHGRSVAHLRRALAPALSTKRSDPCRCTRRLPRCHTARTLRTTFTNARGRPRER